MLNKKLIRSAVMMPLISALILACASCRRDYLTSEGQTWGTYYRIVYSSDVALDDSIIAELKSIDNEFSLFNPNSTVSKINSGECSKVGPRFVEVMDMCRKVNGLSGGVYDPTVGPVAELWGFGKRKISSAPTQQQVDSALCHVGIADCRITDDGTIEKKSDGTLFDFSSIAKGYGLDCIADMLERNGCSSYMIEIGGEVLAKGVNPKGAPWRIQVDSPQSGFGHEALRIVELGPDRTGLATSGDYRNFVNLGDSVYGHTISPVTGYPVRGRVLSATIKSESCAFADALATACMASADADAASGIVKKAGVGAIIVAADSLDRPVVFSIGM